MNGPIYFEEATLEQLTRTEKLIDDFGPNVIDFLLRWVSDSDTTWSADYDLTYFEERKK